MNRNCTTHSIDRRPAFGRHIIALALGAVILGLLPAPAAAQDHTFAGPLGPSLAGAWEVDGHFDPSAGLPDFVNFATMTRDGLVVNVDPSEGTAVGAWQRAGGHEYDVTFHGFNSETGPTLRWTVIADVNVEPSGNGFSGPFRVQFYQLDGTPVFSAEGTVSGTRLPIQQY